MTVFIGLHLVLHVTVVGRCGTESIQVSSNSFKIQSLFVMDIGALGLLSHLCVSHACELSPPGGSTGCVKFREHLFTFVSVSFPVGGPMSCAPLQSQKSGLLMSQKGPR